MRKYKDTALIIALTAGVYLLSSNQFTKHVTLPLALFMFVGIIAYGYRIRRQEQPEKAGKAGLENKTLLYLIITLVLLLVASTGWFYSPFFFTLYLLALILAFEFNPSVSIGFVATLVGLFSMNVGEVDIAYDFLIILSLISVIPLALYLRKEYLRLKEAEKEILVLKGKSKDELPNTVEDILANRIHKLGVDLRQPINDVKQLTHHMVTQNIKTKREELQDRIISSSEEALRTIKKFEEDATGKKLISSTKTSPNWGSGK